MEMRGIGDELRLDPDYNLELDGVHENDENAEVPAVQMRQKKKTAKAINVDDPPELRNSDLARWNTQYLQNMAIASKLKENNKLITVAKKNAAFWVLGVGIASVGTGVGTSRIPHPLEAFSGDQLLGALTGKPLETSRRKRNRDANGAGLYNEGRNVRQKVGEQELPRRDGPDDENGPGLLYDVRDSHTQFFKKYP